MIPGLDEIFKFYESGPNQPSQIKTLGDLLSNILNIAFIAATFLAFIWLAWGAFAYMMASGKKEDLAKARARITWALIGLLITFLAFAIARFVGEIFPQRGGIVPF